MTILTKNRRRLIWPLVAFTAALAGWEMKTSFLQSYLLSHWADQLQFQVTSGPAETIQFPTQGPYNERLGYRDLPKFLANLQTNTTAKIIAQSRWSEEMQQQFHIGMPPSYREKFRAGLQIADRNHFPLWTSQYPRRTYNRWDDIPAPVYESLLFIENRELLSHSVKSGNPDATIEDMMPEFEQVLKDPKHPKRVAYLKRFANFESTSLLQKFRRKYKGLSAAESLRAMTKEVGVLRRVAVVHRTAFPNATLTQFNEFMQQAAGLKGMDKKQVERYFQEFQSGRFSWKDLAYLAKSHPIELWYVSHLQHHSDSSWQDLIAASKEVRNEVADWFMGRKNTARQNQRIKTIIEQDAFKRIGRSWQELGYPFENLVPSYATAIGSSGDRPSSLSRLIGIIIRGGWDYPLTDVTTLHFAEGTPYETVVKMEPKAPLRKLNPVLATTLQQELVKVVQHGTARRLKGAYNIADTFPAGGKTGTGDNRYTVKDADGKEQQVLANRTATFAFFLGQRWFGVVTAYAPDNADFRHKFTSSLPVSILKSLSENLAPLLESPKPHQPLPLANSHKELPVQAH